MSTVGSAGTVWTKEPRPGKRTWQPATVTIPGWERAAAERRAHLPEPVEIPPKPSGPRWRVKRWLQLYAEGETR